MFVNNTRIFRNLNIYKIRYNNIKLLRIYKIKYESIKKFAYL